MAVGSPVELIKNKLDLLELIGSYVPGLKKSGRNWWVCCPFHSEKTPSFCIWPEDGRWKCFGCNAGGDAFSFVERIENVDFVGALQLLAEKTGVALEDRPRAPEDVQRKRRLLDLHAAASLWFHDTLLHAAAGDQARAFVERRHLSHQTVVDFQLGYAPDSWDALRTHLSSRGYSVDEQLAAGVLHESDRGTPYDRFRNRLIYPIRDAGGQIIAFGGRDLGADKRAAKFINSPQTLLFDKSATVYGLDRARNAIHERDQVIVVEGYMDAIMAHQHGEANVVCSMGTALTERQIEQLKRLTTKLVLCLDPDAAGDAATGRGIEIGEQVFDRELVPVPSVTGYIRLEARLKADIRVMSLPRGKDPDEVIHEDPAAWSRLVEQALPLLEYKFQQVVARHGSGNVRDKLALVDELGRELALIPDRVERLHYIGKVTQHLSNTAGAFQLRESDLHEAVAKAAALAAGTPRRSAGSQRSNRAEDPPASEARGRVSQGAPATVHRASALPLRLEAEDFLLMRALRYLDEARPWIQNLAASEVSKSENREVLQFLQANLDQDGSPSSPPDGSSSPLSEHLLYLRDLASREPPIAEADLAAEFERLVLRVREVSAMRKQADRATQLSHISEGRAGEVETGARADLDTIHRLKRELDRRTVLAKP